MQEYRFSISFVVTTVLYSSLGFLFFYFNDSIVKISPPPEQIITMSLSSFEPMLPSPPIEEVVEEPVIEEPLPEPIVKNVIPILPPKVKKKKIIKKRKKKKKVIKKKIIKKKKRKKKKKVKKRVRKRKPIKHHRTKKSIKKVKTSKQRSSKKRTHINPIKKAKFLNLIRGKIDKNKSYPRIAKRRGMQGSVTVSFTLLVNGKIANLKVKGKKVFQSSARKAVLKSFPINVKNAPLKLPKKIRFTLRYQIR